MCVTGVDEDVVEGDAAFLLDAAEGLIGVIAADHENIDGDEAQLDVAVNDDRRRLELSLLPLYEAGTDATTDDHCVFSNHLGGRGADLPGGGRRRCGEQMPTSECRNDADTAKRLQVEHYVLRGRGKWASRETESYLGGNALTVSRLFCHPVEPPGSGGSRWLATEAVHGFATRPTMDLRSLLRSVRVLSGRLSVAARWWQSAARARR